MVENGKAFHVAIHVLSHMPYLDFENGLADKTFPAIASMIATVSLAGDFITS